MPGILMSYWGEKYTEERQTKENAEQGNELHDGFDGEA